MRQRKDDFKRGDRVREKHGHGPSMIVEEVYLSFYYFRYRCQWTDKDGARREEVFRSEDLMVELPSPAPAPEIIKEASDTP